MTRILPRLCAVALLAVAPALAAAAQDGPAPCDGGAAGPFACDGVDLLARLAPTDMGSYPAESCIRGTCVKDVWGWTDPESGREYALVGLANGTAFVDVTIPEAPLYLGLLPTRAIAGYWRDIKVHADHAFVVADMAGQHGMQVFDLTRLRSVTSPPATFTEDAVYTEFASAHNVAINEATGFAYVVGASYGGGAPPTGCAATDSRGHHAVDVRDPLNPTLAGCFSDAAFDPDPNTAPGYTHDTQCVVYEGPDADYAGREVCFGANADAIALFDVTDKAAPTLISQAVYPNVGYTHQGWLTEDHRYFIANDEKDEREFGAPTRTLVFDVSDLDEPEFLDEYFHPTASTDHNLYVRGRYVYEANYTAGLRILDAQPLFDGTGLFEEVASFDTYPDSDGAELYGAWSVYPFFESGTLLVTDDTYGLFVLRASGLATGSEGAPAFADDARLSAHPNPGRGALAVSLTLGRPGRVEVAALDVLGRRVATLHAGLLPEGPHTFRLDGQGLPSGFYIVRATSDRLHLTHRVTLVH